MELGTCRPPVIEYLICNVRHDSRSFLWRFLHFAGCSVDQYFENKVSLSINSPFELNYLRATVKRLSTSHGCAESFIRVVTITKTKMWINEVLRLTSIKNVYRRLPRTNVWISCVSSRCTNANLKYPEWALINTSLIETTWNWKNLFQENLDFSVWPKL